MMRAYAVVSYVTSTNLSIGSSYAGVELAVWYRRAVYPTMPGQSDGPLLYVKRSPYVTDHPWSYIWSATYYGRPAVWVGDYWADNNTLQTDRALMFELLGAE